MADKKITECLCRKKKGKGKSKFLAATATGKRKRQTLVHNPEEEIWHEPYMNCLRKEFSQISIPCDSKIELPWKDIALPAVAQKIRANVVLNDNIPESNDENQETLNIDEEKQPEAKESNGKMNLPWKDLLVIDTVVPDETLQANGAPCNSTLEIPWDDLAIEKPIQIIPIPDEEPCDNNDVEIPWDDILVPANIVIETHKKKKHPSSKFHSNNNESYKTGVGVRNVQGTSHNCRVKPNCCVNTGWK